MLAGVILHSAKAFFPVDAAVKGAADEDWLVYIMHHIAIFLVGVEHRRLTDKAAVARLTAALGEKRSAVEYDLVPILHRLTGKHRSGEGLHVAVNIIKLFCHIARSVCFFAHYSILQAAHASLALKMKYTAAKTARTRTLTPMCICDDIMSYLYYVCNVAILSRSRYKKSAPKGELSLSGSAQGVHKYEYLFFYPSYQQADSGAD